MKFNFSLEVQIFKLSQLVWNLAKTKQPRSPDTTVRMDVFCYFYSSSSFFVPIFLSSSFSCDKLLLCQIRERSLPTVLLNRTSALSLHAGRPVTHEQFVQQLSSGTERARALKRVNFNTENTLGRYFFGIIERQTTPAVNREG